MTGAIDDAGPHIWMCPVCGEGLVRVDGSQVCEAGHTFDVAREGYVNLLLAHHRRSDQAGDPPGSLAHRRSFLAAGYFAPLARELCAMVAQRLQAAAVPAALDVGCGEGYYLRQLADSPDLPPGVTLHGLDVSKAAIRLAARATSRIDYAVGNAFRMPVRADSVAVALQVLAPSEPDEVCRVLATDGVFISVVPGPAHLQQLRSHIYLTPQVHEVKDPAPVFRLVQQERLSWEVDLPTREEVSLLLEMTPYKWHMDPETYDRVRRLPALRERADFIVRVLAAA